VDSPLPIVTDAVEIDGTTEPDHTDRPVIELDGTNAGTGPDADGLKVDFVLNGGGDLIVRDLSIVNFDASGVVFSNAQTGNRITGCHIGVRADGTTQAPNRRGIFTGGGARVVIGGASATDENIVSGNDARAVDATGDTRIIGNRIGVDINGDPLGNGQSVTDEAISLNSDDSDVEGNIIAYNSGVGVAVIDITPPNTRNTIRGNNMFSNGGIGIDLEGGTEDADGRTQNDPGDGDDGQNRFQNTPEIQSATYDAGTNTATITYLVDSDPSLTGSGSSAYDLIVDFYKADADGEEGTGIIGTDTYTAADHGNCASPPCAKTVSLTPLATVTEQDNVSATATDANGNTSEFSASSQPLPVELTTFDATHSDSGVRLNWATASETNNAGFAVERKLDSGSFAQIGFVEGAGTTATSRRYQFADAEVPFTAETLTYRLKQIDTDGTATYSAPVELDRRAPQQLVLHPTAPNPVRTQTTLRYELPQAGPVRIAVYDMLGRRVSTLVNETQSAGRNEVMFNARKLPSGTYFIHLQAEGRTLTKRLTVVR